LAQRIRDSDRGHGSADSCRRSASKAQRFRLFRRSAAKRWRLSNPNLQWLKALRHRLIVPGANPAERISLRMAIPITAQGYPAKHNLLKHLRRCVCQVAKGYQVKDSARPASARPFFRLCSASVIFIPEAESSAFAKKYKSYGGKSHLAAAHEQARRFHPNDGGYRGLHSEESFKRSGPHPSR